MLTESTTTEKALEEGSIVEKCYTIDYEKIEDGHEYTNQFCYAKTINEAKSALHKLIKYIGMKHRFTGEAITYLNIPVIRHKSLDRVVFEGKVIEKAEIDYILEKRKRLAKFEAIAQNPAIKYCYIVKGAYYRPNYCGYTTRMVEAGVYPKMDAIEHVINVTGAVVHPVDIEEHNKLVTKEIEFFKNLLIHDKS